MPQIESQPVMSRDDVMRETLAHVRRVASLMLDAIENLQRRAVCHDDTKFSPEEFNSFARETPGLKSVTYGSPEYRAAMDRIRPAIDHHQGLNRHHPEYHQLWKCAGCGGLFKTGDAPMTILCDDKPHRMCPRCCNPSVIWECELMPHGGGFDEMNLLDLIELLADWKAAGERHADGDLRRSIEINAERFGYDDVMKRRLYLTAASLGWCA